MNKFIEPQDHGDRPWSRGRLDGRLFVEKLNWPVLTEFGALPAEWRAGIERAVEKGWLWKHESGSYYRFTEAGKDLFT
jgi:DNA-binding transcriptional regulator PaaX